MSNECEDRGKNVLMMKKKHKHTKTHGVAWYKCPKRHKSNKPISPWPIWWGKKKA